MASAVRIAERVNASPFDGAGADFVDEANGLIRNAGICGLTSENGRDYPPEVHRRDCGKYDGARVFFEHSDGERVFRDWVGVLRQPTAGATGSRGNIELLTKDPNYGKLVEALRKFPDKIGMSHVAMCKTRRGADGREVVEAIESVESVDIVLNPATNPNGFFRRESKGGRAVGVTLKEWAAKFVRHPRATVEQVLKVKRLAEMEGYGDVALGDDMPAPDDEAAEPADGISEAFKTAIMHCVDAALGGEEDPKECLRKIKSLLNSHADVNGGKGAAGPEEEESAEESKKPTGDGALREAVAIATRIGWKGFDADDLDAITAVPPARREAVARRLMGVARDDGGEKPRSGGRDQFARHAEEKAAAKTVAEGKGGEKTTDEQSLAWVD